MFVWLLQYWITGTLSGPEHYLLAPLFIVSPPFSIYLTSLFFSQSASVLLTSFFKFAHPATLQDCHCPPLHTLPLSTLPPSPPACQNDVVFKNKRRILKNTIKYRLVIITYGSKQLDKVKIYRKLRAGQSDLGEQFIWGGRIFLKEFRWVNDLW